jgi:hypothetical protein
MVQSGLAATPQVQAAPRVQDRLAAYLIGIGRTHLHPKWQALWAELS